MTTDAMIGRAGKCMFFLRVDGTSRTPALPYRPTELIIVKFFCAERADGHCSLSFSCRSERACGALCLASIRRSAESRRLSMANSDQKARDTLAADETDELISSEKVEGTAVYDRKGDKIGTVHHLMINKYTGQVAYAVISFGGFLGIGAEYHPIPWRLLDYDEEVGGYVVDLDQEQLKKAPHFAENREPDWSDRAYAARIDEYWIIAP